MSDMTEALLPCPFCGAPATHVPTSRVVECSACTGGFFSDSDELAIAAWNRRSAIASRQPVVTDEMAEAAGAVIEKQVGAFADMSPSFYPWLARQAIEAALTKPEDSQ